MKKRNIIKIMIFIEILIVICVISIVSTNISHLVNQTKEMRSHVGKRYSSGKDTIRVIDFDLYNNRYKLHTGVTVDKSFIDNNYKFVKE